ncbi:SIR2 family NAD-dependent protein deacylase [Mucilaginibacter psychrotolerans]|uniref:SIR2 family protein n=1 Tax=Mucilaginibacter psychrotolerans TaxID=1524096 RepID=A0A4Y8SF50_9SPHI|nr:SIR2 family protein [Mucilaginibacter psychrotolerans]TFF37713.1 SIR2 family protein [Mucilaginibacter psychrotolerans]
MDLAELYDLIRKEPVCLFIGSGFSLYTGMPSAYRLIGLLHDSLTPAQQKKIRKTEDLRKYAQDFQTLFGRPKLVRVLQEHFDIKPADTHVHDMLGKIAYFKSIITTNYDRLIEDGFGQRATVIVNNQQVFGTKRAKTRILKIHGDIRDGKSIVITSGDYSDQYNRIFKDPFWATVIAETAAQHIIFLGFGYEDENVQADFDYIEKKLKNKLKKRVLISPGVDPVKLKRYRQLGMQHISATGEQFVNGLVETLKAHVKNDMEDGLVDQQTAMDFIMAFDLTVSIEASLNHTQLIDIKRSDGPTQHKLQISTADEELKSALQKFTTGYEVRQLQIAPEQLTSFDFLIEGFRMLDKDSLGTLNVIHHPKYEGFVKVRFPGKLFALHKVYCRLFNNIPGKVRIEIEVTGFEAVFNLEFKDNRIEMTFTAREPELPTPVNKSYEVFRAFYLLFSGELMEIVAKDGSIYKHRLTAQAQAAEFNKQMTFFHSLKKIEKTFDVKFDPVKIGNVTDDDREKIAKLQALIGHGYYAIKDPTGITIEQMPDSRELFNSLGELIPGTYVSLVTKSHREMDLFGKTLLMGNEQVTLRDPAVPVLDFQALRMQLIPSDHIVIYHYQKFGLQKLAGAQSIWPETGDEGEEDLI